MNNKKEESISNASEQLDGFIKRTTENYNNQVEGTSYTEILKSGKAQFSPFGEEAKKEVESIVDSIKDLRNKNMEADSTSENKPKNK